MRLNRLVFAAVSLCIQSQLSESQRENDLISSMQESVGRKERVDVLTDMFDEWIEQFDREYATAKEKAHRMMVWFGNHEYIENHNRKEPKPSYFLAHNHFPDMTTDEFQRYNFLGKHSPGVLSRSKRSDNLRKRSDENEITNHRLQDQAVEHEGDVSVERRLLNKAVPKSINLVEKGALTPVKNQGLCGACWAFSAIGSIESARFVETGDLISLSEQQLLDCDLQDHSCMGGLMDSAFTFDESSDGLCSEQDYPYVMHRHIFFGCERFKSKCTVVPNTKVTKFFDIANTTIALMKAISEQPVSVGIDASAIDFQFYKSGVYDNKCGTNLDHGVIAVGYGTDNGEGYWLVRNSWGSNWGDRGYMKMSRETKNAQDEGQCGIQLMASRPVLVKEV